MEILRIWCESLEGWGRNAEVTQGDREPGLGAIQAP